MEFLTQIKLTAFHTLGSHYDLSYIPGPCHFKDRGFSMYPRLAWYSLSCLCLLSTGIKCLTHRPRSNLLSFNKWGRESHKSIDCWKASCGEANPKLWVGGSGTSCNLGLEKAFLFLSWWSIKGLQRPSFLLWVLPFMSVSWSFSHQPLVLKTKLWGVLYWQTLKCGAVLGKLYYRVIVAEGKPSMGERKHSKKIHSLFEIGLATKPTVKEPKHLKAHLWLVLKTGDATKVLCGDFLDHFRVEMLGG